MSTNLDLVRSICAHWERGDFDATGWAHPEIEVVVADGVQAGSYRGLAAMAQWEREWLGAWDECRLAVDEYREVDNGRVLVLAWNAGRAKGSGVELAQVHARSAVLFHVRDGRVTRLVLYGEGDNALADLGLEE
jgi:ketosteroid isomerase-like protein